MAPGATSCARRSSTARVWVPGDSETRSFFVRNDGPSDARLVISVVTQDDDRLLADDDLLAVRVAVRVAGRRRRQADE